jgi:hypothetical protein
MTNPDPNQDETVGADERAFDRLWAILAGRRLFAPLDGGSSKMLRSLVRGSGTDSVITRDRFVVSFESRRTVLPASYPRSFAPRVLNELLSRARASRVTEPTLIGLPAREVGVAANPVRSDGSSYPAYPALVYDSKLVWIVPSTDVVKVVVRNAAESVPWPYVRDIPSEGPLALPESLG